MSALRFSAAIVITLIGVLAALSSTTLAIGAQQRIDEDRRYLQCFAKAAADLQRNPSPPPFHDRKFANPGCPDISTGGYDPADADMLEALGTPPPGATRLSFWRGEWLEYYAPWSGESTLLATAQRYWRAFALDCAVGSLIALACFAGAALIMRAERRSSRLRQGADT